MSQAFDTGPKKADVAAPILLLAFTANAVLAGANAVAVRFINRELDPLWGAAMRFLLSTTLLVLIMLAMRITFPTGGALKASALYGVFQFAGAFGLTHFALVTIRAGFAQTILALVPLATLLLATIQGQEHLTLRASSGSMLGLAGVALISFDPLRADVSAPAVLAMVLSVGCFAQAAVIVQRLPSTHPVAMNAVGMGIGAVLLVGASLVAGENLVLPQRGLTALSLGYLSAIGSVVVFLLFVFVLHNWSATRASYVMVIIPFVTVALSAWLDAEPISARLVAGGFLVVAGVYIGALRKSTPRSVPAPASLCGAGVTALPSEASTLQASRSVHHPEHIQRNH